MSVVRTVFLGTPFIAKECLEALHKDEHFEVIGVISQPDRPAGRKMKLMPSAVKAFAVENNLPCLTPEKAKGDDFLKAIEEMGAECAVVVAYGQILTQKFLDLFPQKVVNVHASLLPKWRGAAPIQRSVMAGEKETGVCLQVMTKKLDAGAVIGERRIEVQDDWSAMDLHDQLIPLAQNLLTVDFMDYLRGNLAAKEQDESQVTYAHKLDKSESLLDWEKPAKEIHDHIRGMQMGPGTYTFRNSKKLKVIRTEVLSNGSGQGQPGEVVDISKDAFAVACGDGNQLRLLVVQPESKPKMKTSEYLKGQKVEKGEVLGR